MKISKPKLQTTGFIVSQRQKELDLAMAAFDIWGTKAHVLMLVKSGVIGEVKAKAIFKALQKIEKDVASGNFQIDPELGAQLSLEKKIVELAGNAGYSVHTGRSRNDQVMVTEMLYLREKVLELQGVLLDVISELVDIAAKHRTTVMPGYTHMQPGKITTLGQWSLSFANAFLRTFKTLQHYYTLYSLNPLGACESYGTSWMLDRKYTTFLLGFDNVWEIPQDAISSRGMVQLGYLTAFRDMCLVGSKLAQDLLLMSTFEYGMIELGEEVSQRMHPITGSSVMPQKKNPDVLELIRSTAPQVGGFTEIVSGILSKLPMGYNRDSREVKEYMDLGITKTKDMLINLRKTLLSIRPNKERMRELVVKSYLLTVDLADKISQDTKIGYRIIYKIVGHVVDEAIKQERPIVSITAQELINCAKELGVSLSVTDKQVQDAMDVERIIQSRRYLGGSSKKTMLVSIAHSKKEVSVAYAWLQQNRKRILKAQEKTMAQVKKLLT